MSEAEEGPPMAPPDEDADLRRRIRRFGIGLCFLVMILASLTVGYVLLYGRLLRDPDAPPSVRSLNPRVLSFEIALWATVALGLGFGLNHFLRKRR